MIRRLWLQQLISEEKKSAEIGWPLQFPHRSAIYIFFFKGIYSETWKKFRVIIHHRPIVYFLFWLFIGAAQTIDGLILSRPGTTFIFSSKKLLWITHDSLSRREDIEKKIHAEAAAAEDEKILCVYITAAPFAWWLNLSVACWLPRSINTTGQSSLLSSSRLPNFYLYFFSTRLKLFLF